MVFLRSSGRTLVCQTRAQQSMFQMFHLRPKSRRLRAKQTRNRLWTAAQSCKDGSSSVCQAVQATSISTNTQTQGTVTEELVPISAVEKVVEEAYSRMHIQYEDSSRTLVKEMFAKYEADAKELQDKLNSANEELVAKKAAVEELQHMLAEARLGGCDDCDDSSFYEDDELGAGMQPRATGSSMPSSSASQGGAAHRNDMSLPTTVSGAIDWERAMPSDVYAEFRLQQDHGKFNCSGCSIDVSSAQGSAGYVQCLRSDGDWEGRHPFNVVEDAPELLLCLRCHCASVPCRYFNQGWCSRGENCMYKH